MISIVSHLYIWIDENIEVYYPFFYSFLLTHRVTSGKHLSNLDAKVLFLVISGRFWSQLGSLFINEDKYSSVLNDDVRNHFIYLNLQAIHRGSSWCFVKWVASFLLKRSFPLGLAKIQPHTVPLYPFYWTSIIFNKVC